MSTDLEELLRANLPPKESMIPRSDLDMNKITHTYKI